MGKHSSRRALQRDWETCLPVGKRRRVAALQKKASALPLLYFFITKKQGSSLENARPHPALSPKEREGAHGVTRPTSNSFTFTLLFHYQNPGWVW